jgi:transcriptional regulator with XRE-family HTH domain
MKFRDKKYRRSYVRSHTNHFLARQLRAFRGGKSQTEFASDIGVSQSVVSERLENPNYGKHNLQKLFDIAENLDVALFVRFVDHETFLRLTRDMSEAAVRPHSYNENALKESPEEPEVTVLLTDLSRQDEEIENNGAPRTAVVAA